MLPASFLNTGILTHILGQQKLFKSIRACIAHATQPAQSNLQKGSVLKQKCREDLVQLEVEPMPDVSRETKVDHCTWWPSKPEGKFPVLRVLAACFFGGQLGANLSERHWSKCKNTTRTKCTNQSSESLDKLMINNSCLKNRREIRYNSAPICPIHSSIFT